MHPVCSVGITKKVKTDLSIWIINVNLFPFKIKSYIGLVTNDVFSWQVIVDIGE